MSETPDEPRPPGDDAAEQDQHLPPLDDEIAGTASRRRWLGGGRLAMASIGMVVLLGGGVAVALSGGSDGDGGSDGVATVDGTDGDQAQGDDQSGGNRGGRPDPSEFEDAMLEYAECMRDHGIDMPDPEFSGDGGGVVIAEDAPDEDGGGPALDSEEFEVADEECGEIMEDVAGELPQMSPEDQAELQDQMVAMAECMREKGYDMPDPQVSGDGAVTFEIGGDGSDDARALGDPRSEQFQQDQEECDEQAGLDDGPLGGGPLAGAGADGASS